MDKHEMARQSSPLPPPAPPLTAHQGFWLLGAACVCFAPLLPHLPAWVGALTTLLLLWYGDRLRQRVALPSRRILLALALAGAGAIGLHFQSLLGRTPGVALLSLLVALKLLETRTPRDGFAIVLLGYFLVLTQFFHDQSLISATLMLGGVVITTAALIVLNRAQQPPLRALRLAGTMLVQALPFMLVLFALFPRVQGPLWGLPADAFGGTSGLADSMAPGSIGQLSLSDAIAFRVQFDGDGDSGGRPPPREALYWRGPVLDKFDGRTWSSGRRVLSTHMPYALPLPASDAPPLDYTVTLEAHDKPWLFALDLPLTLPPDSQISADYQLLAKTPVRARLRYRMRSAPRLVAGRDESESMLRRALQLPPDFNPRTRALAATWRNELGDNGAAIARRMLEYIRRENFVYTLLPPLLGEDSVDEFLFGTRRGFCEHYAAAFVFAMRAAGIPARVVTGYQGGEINPVDGTLIVRQSDAHAWTEIWLGNRGWLRVDPTAAIAPARIEQNLAGALPAGEPRPLLMLPEYRWLHDMRFRWEALANVWNQWIVGYNPQRQRELLASLGMHSPDWRQMTTLLATLCSLLLLAFSAWAMYRRQRSDPALAAWNRFSHKLAGIGLARHAWEGPDDYVRRICAGLPEKRAAQTGEIHAIAALYTQLRYAAPPPDDMQQIRRLRQLQRRVADFPRLRS